jgi:hypothetical protein
VTLDQYDEQLTLVIEKTGHIRPLDLERIAGVFFLSRNQNGDLTNRAQRLHERTPHVPLNEAQAAAKQLDEFTKEMSALAKV